MDLGSCGQVEGEWEESDIEMGTDGSQDRHVVGMTREHQKGMWDEA